MNYKILGESATGEIGDKDCVFFIADLSGRIVDFSMSLSDIKVADLTIIRCDGGIPLLQAYLNEDYAPLYYAWDGTKIELIEPDTAVWKNLTIERINSTHAGLLAKFTGNASTEERDTWPIKLALAKQVIADTASSTDTALMGVEAVVAGITTLELANVIVTKAENYSRLIWLAGSIRKKGIEQVKAASEYSEIAAIETGLLADVDTAVVEYLTAIGGA